MICGGCGVINGCSCFRSNGKPSAKMKEHLNEFERQMEQLVTDGKLTRDQADGALRVQGITPAHLRGQVPQEEAVPEPQTSPSGKPKFVPPTHKKSVAQMNETEKANAKRIAEARAIANKVAKEQAALISGAETPPQEEPKEPVQVVASNEAQVRLVEARENLKKVAEETFTKLEKETTPSDAIVQDALPLQPPPEVQPPSPAVQPPANTGIHDLQAELSNLYNTLAAQGLTDGCILLRATQETIKALQVDSNIVETIISTRKDADLVLLANTLGAKQGDFIRRWRKWKNERGVGTVVKSPVKEE
jgi:hypothetical protein